MTTVRSPVGTGPGVFGRVDRVDRIDVYAADDEAAQTGLRVTDYKTGRHILDPDELAEERPAQVYAPAASRTLLEPVAEVRYLYLRENTAVSWQIEREDLALIESKLETKIERISAEEEFEARPDFHCRWCKHRQLCPEGLGRISPDDLDADAGTAF